MKKSLPLVIFITEKGFNKKLAGTPGGSREKWEISVSGWKFREKAGSFELGKIEIYPC